MKWNKLIKTLIVAPLAALLLSSCGNNGSSGTLSLNTIEASMTNEAVTESADASNLAGTMISAQIFNGTVADAKYRVRVPASTIGDIDGLYALFF